MFRTDSDIFRTMGVLEFRGRFCLIRQVVEIWFLCFLWMVATPAPPNETYSGVRKIWLCPKRTVFGQPRGGLWKNPSFKNFVWSSYPSWRKVGVHNVREVLLVALFWFLHFRAFFGRVGHLFGRLEARKVVRSFRNLLFRISGGKLLLKTPKFVW